MRPRRSTIAEWTIFTEKESIFISFSLILHRLYYNVLKAGLKGMETIQKYEINFAQTFKIC